MTFPRQQFWTNRLGSDSFPVCRGTRQACPLVPFLFAIVPLAEDIQLMPSIQGMQDSVHYKISPYADEVLVFVTNPERSIQALINVMDLFSKFSATWRS